MAQKIETHYVCDLSGDPAAETIRFGLDNRSYEIDLTGDNANQLRDALRTYVAAARRITGRATPRGTRPARTDREQNQAVRDWARQNGHDVADRGRIPEKIQLLFNARH